MRRRVGAEACVRRRISAAACGGVRIGDAASARRRMARRSIGAAEYRRGRGARGARGARGYPTRVLTAAASSARPFLASAKNIEVLGLV